MTPLEIPILEIVKKPDSKFRKLTMREVFFIRATITCQSMIGEIAAFPVAHRMGLPSEAALGRGFESMPEEYRELSRSAAKIVLTILGQ